MNKKIKRENTIIGVADFETLTSNSKTYLERERKGLKGKTDVVYWAIAIKKDKVYGDWGIESFFEFLFSYVKDKHKSGTFIIYFHNLPFDGDFITKYIRKNNLKSSGRNVEYKLVQESETLTKKEKTNKRWWSFKSANDRIYNIELNYPWKEDGYKKHFTFIFKDSVKFLPSSVEAIGKVYGYEKFNDIDSLIEKGIVKDKEDFYNNVDFNLKEPKTEREQEIRDSLIKYCIQDCEIILKAMIDFEEGVQKHPFNRSLSNCMVCKIKHIIKECEVCLDYHSYCKCTNLCYQHPENLHTDKCRNMCYNHINNLCGTGKKAIESLNSLVSLPGLMGKLHKSILTKKEYQCRDKYTYQLGEESYRGGLTQLNSLYIGNFIPKTPNGCGVLFDINSSYPSAMTEYLPYGTKLSIEEYEAIENKCENQEHLKNLEACDKNHFVSLEKVKIKFKIKSEWTTFPLLPKPKSYMNVFNYGLQLTNIFSFYGEEAERDAALKAFFGNGGDRYLKEGIGVYTFWTKELETLRKFYDIEILMSEKWYFHTTNTLSHITKYDYKQRLIAKQNKDAATDFRAKVGLNSSYGKYGERRQYTTRLETTMKLNRSQSENDLLAILDNLYRVKTIKDNKTYHYVNGIEEEYFVYDLIKQEDENTLFRKGKVRNILFASYITMLGRVKLMNTIYKVGPEQILYCDTDSVFVYLTDGNYEKEHLEKQWDITIDSKVLGAWKHEDFKWKDSNGVEHVEMTFDTAIFIASKFYYIFGNQGQSIKKGSGGVSKNKNKINSIEDIKNNIHKEIAELESYDKDHIENVMIQEKEHAGFVFDDGKTYLDRLDYNGCVIKTKTITKQFGTN